MLRTSLIAILSTVLLASALAARNFPADTKRGELKSAEYPYVQIGKETIKLAPGVKIFDTNNQLILPTRLPQKAPVMYKLEGSTGMLLNLWLLTSEEADATK